MFSIQSLFRLAEVFLGPAARQTYLHGIASRLSVFYADWRFPGASLVVDRPECVSNDLR